MNAIAATILTLGLAFVVLHMAWIPAPVFRSIKRGVDYHPAVGLLVLAAWEGAVWAVLAVCAVAYRAAL